jgi:hypothetical protein
VELKVNNPPAAVVATNVGVCVTDVNAIGSPTINPDTVLSVSKFPLAVVAVNKLLCVTDVNIILLPRVKPVVELTVNIPLVPPPPVAVRVVVCILLAENCIGIPVVMPVVLAKVTRLVAPSVALAVVEYIPAIGT